MSKSLPLATKLALSFGTLVIVTLALGGVGFYAVTQTGKAVSEISDEHLPGVRSLLEIKVGATAVKAAQRTLLNPNLTAELRQRQYDNIAAAEERCDSASKIYAALPQTADQAALWKQFVPAWETWRKQSDEFLRLCREIDKIGIHNPPELVGMLNLFRGDHYRAESAVLQMLTNKHMFEGGEDPTQCNFGKWSAKFTTQNADMKRALEDMVQYHNKFHGALPRIKELVRQDNLDGARAAFEQEMAPAAEQVFKRFDSLKELAAATQDLAAKAEQQALVTLRDVQLQAEDLLDKNVKLGVQTASTTSQNAIRRATLLKSTSLAGAIASVVIGFLAAFAISRSITKPLRALFRGLKSFSTLELRQTGEHFNRIIDSMADGAAQVNDASGQVSSASQQLAEGASEQASALEQTSSALEQMAAMARTNAANSKEANELATQSHKAAADGEKTMIGINEASDKISKIIKVIEEIAFQTNLLALNAAVEAARAGEHGKGFAVVAEEVRNLAQRAAGAAKETTGLIEESVTKSREGKTAIQTIVGGVAKVTELINGISRASEEQAQGVDQVNTAVSQMDKVTQQNAAGAEESASAAEELSAQAATTQSLVGELMVLIRGNDAKLATSSATRARTGQKPPPVTESHHRETVRTPKRAKLTAAGNAGPALHGTTAAHDVAGTPPGDSLKDF